MKETENVKGVSQQLSEIVDEFKKLKEPTQEQINGLKNREFALYEKISTARELADYLMCDMTIDGTSDDYRRGTYSGVINGVFFVVNKVNQVLDGLAGNDCTKGYLCRELRNEMKTILGLELDDGEPVEDNQDNEHECSN